MYKKQVSFQRIICFAVLIVGALFFVYSLGMLTDLYDTLYSMILNPNDLDNAKVTGARIYYDMQPFNHQLLISSLASHRSPSMQKPGNCRCFQERGT